MTDPTPVAAAPATPAPPSNPGVATPPAPTQTATPVPNPSLANTPLYDIAEDDAVVWGDKIALWVEAHPKWTLAIVGAFVLAVIIALA